MEEVLGDVSLEIQSDSYQFFMDVDDSTILKAPSF